MPKRPKQHILEDISKAKFNALVSEYGWCFKDKPSGDYGVDAEVEIFDKNGSTTGLLFYAQIKSSDDPTTKTILKIDTLKYYRQLDIPVLIVRWHNREKRFYCRWAYSIDLYGAKKNAKTHSFLFNTNEIWSETTPGNILSAVKAIRLLKNKRISFPINVSLECNFDQIKGVSAKKFYSIFRDVAAKDKRILLVDKLEDHFTKIKITSDTATIAIANHTGFVLHNIQDLMPDLHIVLMTLLGVVLSKSGHYQQAAELINDYIYDTPFINLQLSVGIFRLLFEAGRYKEAFRYANKITRDSKENNWLIDFFIKKNYFQKRNILNKEGVSEFEKYLKMCLENTEDNQALGIAHYNIANFYKSSRRYKESLRHYKKAIEFAPVYKNQYYYHQEVAASLFLLSKYAQSATSYKKSLELKPDNKTKLLYADALLFSGQYRKAKEIFEEEIVNSNSNIISEHNEEWMLKYELSRGIVDNVGIGIQKRKPTLAIEKAIYNPSLPAKINIHQIESSFKHDALCALAWYNLGWVYYEMEDFPQATFAYSAAALIAPCDIEAWNNAIICAFRAANLDNSFLVFILLILKTAYFHNGEQILLGIREHSEKNNVDNKQIDEIIDAFEKCLEVSKHQKDNNFKIRILNQDKKIISIISFKGSNGVATLQNLKSGK